MNSSAMDSLLTTKLREDALKLRSMAKSSQPAAMRAAMMTHAKEFMMREIFGILTLMLGPPPKPELKFTWEYYDANGQYHKVSKTPLEFAAELSSPSLTRSLGGADVGQLFSLVNDPRHEYGRLLTVNRLGNVIGGRLITYVNVEMDAMKKAGIAMLKAGLPVFFGSDVGKSSNSQTGIMDTALYDYSLAFNIQLNMTKSQRLEAHESAMTHAMVLTAVQVEDGTAVRWRVENSWGDAAGEKGFFVMTDNWMDEFVYQVVVDPSFVSKEVRDVLHSTALELPLWDPMGALA
jgi:bleomycin hydrolase